MADATPADPPADLQRRVAAAERRQDRLETEVSSLVKSVDQMTDKLSGFLREYNQRSRTDWKALIGLVGALGTIGTGAIAGMTWIIMTIEGSRAERMAALFDAMVQVQAEDARRRDQVDDRIITDYRRESDGLRRRLERLEGHHLREDD
ncbi:hypothetical protein [Maricaulis maris]|uniref:Uncharacterized protein n=1 Tax=Maricaulis maris TaxID=74318 RepID=A0A495DLT8_9PROT|nr:hypothetical protein [Maricaulis maris]RKR02686.1 hypothetical protein C7435_0625 [Maricaulis maris]